MADRPSVSRVYIDSNIFIEAFEGFGERADRLAAWFDRLQEHPGLAVTSEFTIAEVLGRQGPFPDSSSHKAFYIGLLVHKTFVDLEPTARNLLQATGDLRRHAKGLGRSLRLPDAIHVATAQQARCAYFLSGDERLSAHLPPTMRHIASNASGIDQIGRLLER